MFSAILLTFLKIFTGILFVVAVVDLLTMSFDRKVQCYKRRGLSQQKIADRLGTTRWQVRKVWEVA